MQSAGFNSPAPEAGRPKVFGIGLNKTGTTTLGTCLQLLGYRHLGVRRDLLQAYRASRKEAVFAVIDRFDSFDDWPYPLMYRELAERYPDAKFVLTVRKSPEIWYASLVGHSSRSRPLKHCRKLAYGYHYPDNARDHHLAFYRRHNREVQEFLGDRVRLLCWENGDSWPELCEFLGAELPQADFPHVNAGKSPSRAKKTINFALKMAERMSLI